jgi:hypothetical protein
MMRRFFRSLSEGVRGELNPATLAFHDRELESAYRADHGARSLLLVRLSLLFAAALYISYSVLDHQVIPERASLLLGIRALGAMFLTLVAVFSVVPHARRYFQATMSLVIVVAGTGVVAILVIAEQAGWNSYYGGLILAVIYAHALLRLRFLYATLTSWGLIALYVVAALGYTHPPPAALMNNLFHIVSANLLGMIASYGLEFYGRRVFLQTRMLDESRRDLAREVERTTTELAAAREIQLAMLPGDLPGHPEVEVAVMMQTAAEVGGDYYDYMIGGDGKLTFAIGDATGHGARAGALVTASKILFSAYADLDTPDQFLERASHILRRVKLPKLFMTMAVGKICGLSLVIAGAGMPPALLARPASGCIRRIALKGVPLGAAYDGRYTAQEIPLEPDDVLLLMSDGFPELFDGRNTMLGYERIEEDLLQAARESPREILDRCARRIDAWRGAEPLRDDLTLIAMKVNGRRGTSPAGITHNR